MNRRKSDTWRGGFVVTKIPKKKWKSDNLSDEYGKNMDQNLFCFEIEERVLRLNSIEKQIRVAYPETSPKKETKKKAKKKKKNEGIIIIITATRVWHFPGHDAVMYTHTARRYPSPSSAHSGRETSYI